MEETNTLVTRLVLLQKIYRAGYKELEQILRVEAPLEEKN